MGGHRGAIAYVCDCWEPSTTHLGAVHLLYVGPPGPPDCTTRTGSIDQSPDTSLQIQLSRKQKFFFMCLIFADEACLTFKRLNMCVHAIGTD